MNSIEEFVNQYGRKGLRTVVITALKNPENKNAQKILFEMLNELEAIFSSVSNPSLNERDKMNKQQLKEQIKTAILEMADDEQLEEDIEHPEEVKDPEPDHFTKLDESIVIKDETASSRKIFQTLREQKELYAPYDKEHLRDKRLNRYKTLVEKFTKGKK